MVEQRILEQSMRLPTIGAVTGWAACRMHGANYFDGLAPDGHTELPVPLAVGPGTTIQRDERVHVTYDRLPAVDVVVRQGVPTVRATRAVFDAMRFASGMRAAVAMLDMAVAALITSIERVAAWAASHPGCTGVAQVRESLPQAREHVRSGPETQLRLVCCLDAGLPRLEVNCPIRNLHGKVLGVADLLDPEAGLVIEFDGAEHRGIPGHNKDLAKDEALRDVKLEVTRVSGTDLRDRDLVVRRVTAARSRAAFEHPARRLWVASPLADGAEQRLQEQEAMQEVFEQWRNQPPYSA